jgi:thioredoxin-like negative regulator of GroEL
VLAHFRTSAAEAERRGDCATATDYYGRIITLLPADRDAHSRLAGLLLRTGQYGKALAQFSEVLHYDRNAVDARLGIAKVLIAQKRVSEAHSILQAVLRLEPSNAEARQLAAQ